jgi:hypothetical protein
MGICKPIHQLLLWFLKGPTCDHPGNNMKVGQKPGFAVRQSVPKPNTCHAGNRQHDREIHAGFPCPFLTVFHGLEPQPPSPGYPRRGCYENGQLIAVLTSVTRFSILGLRLSFHCFHPKSRTNPPIATMTQVSIEGMTSTCH